MGCPLETTIRHRTRRLQWGSTRSSVCCSGQRNRLQTAQRSVVESEDRRTLAFLGRLEINTDRAGFADGQAVSAGAGLGKVADVCARNANRCNSNSNRPRVTELYLLHCALAANCSFWKIQNAAG